MIPAVCAALFTGCVTYGARVGNSGKVSEQALLEIPARYTVTAVDGENVTGRFWTAGSVNLVPPGEHSIAISYQRVLLNDLAINSARRREFNNLLQENALPVPTIPSGTSQILTLTFTIKANFEAGEQYRLSCSLDDGWDVLSGSRIESLVEYVSKYPSGPGTLSNYFLQDAFSKLLTGVGRSSAYSDAKTLMKDGMLFAPTMAAFIEGAYLEGGGAGLGYNASFGYAFGSGALHKAYFDVGWLVGLPDLDDFSKRLLLQHLGLSYQFYIPDTSFAAGLAAGYSFDWMGLLGEQMSDFLYLKLLLTPYSSWGRELNLFFKYYIPLTEAKADAAFVYPAWTIGVGYTIF